MVTILSAYPSPIERLLTLVTSGQKGLAGGADDTSAYDRIRCVLLRQACLDAGATTRQRAQL